MPLTNQSARGSARAPNPNHPREGAMRRPLVSRFVAAAWLAPLCVAAWLLVPASAGAITSAGCDARSNNTPRQLVACIKTNDLWQHMQALQTIADDNPGPDGHASRNAGEPVYKAAVDYV